VLVYFISSLIGLWILHTTSNATLLVPAAIMMGLGQGAEMCIAAFLTGRYFGLKAYGAIYGTYYAIGNAGIATGVFTMGRAHDMAGSYAPMRYVFVASLLVVLALFACLPRYRFTRAAAE
jgi:cyanate permease